MIYKSLNIAVLIRLIILFVLAAGFGIVVFNKLWIVTPFFALGLAISVSELIYFINSINRKVSFFFDAISNEDTTFHFPENTRTKSLNSLHKSLNKLNKHISEIKIINEYNEKFFREMMKNSATGLMAVDEKGYVEFINDSALNLIGLSHISHLQLLQQKNNELYEQLLKAVPGQNRTVKLLHGTELCLISLKVTFLNFSDKKYRIYNLYNIKAELEENELDSWQKLIRVMTHEIMNSVAPITSLSNTLTNVFVKNGHPLSAKKVTQKHIENTIMGLDVIEQTGKGLMHFVENYRKLTKIPKPIFKPVYINSWLKGIDLLMQPGMNKENVQFRIFLKQQCENFIADEKLLNQVIINILDNAVDALKGREKKKITLTVSDNSPGKLKINITDNGSGITSDEIEKIFIPFYTTKENGSGIGLSLSRQIMRLHKGSISAFSIPGEQTTFVLNF